MILWREYSAALAAAAAGAGTAVVLDQTWASNPILAESQAAVRTAIADALADAVLLDSVAWGVPGTDPEVLLTRHLGTVLAVGVELKDLRVIQRNSNGYTVIGSLPGGAPAALQGITTSSLPATATVSVLTSTGRADIILPDASAGWPAEVRSVTAAGAATFPTTYEFGPPAQLEAAPRRRRLRRPGGRPGTVCRLDGTPGSSTTHRVHRNNRTNSVICLICPNCTASKSFRINSLSRRPSATPRPGHERKSS